MNRTSLERASWLWPWAIPCALAACSDGMVMLGDTTGDAGAPLDASVHADGSVYADSGPAPLCKAPAQSAACTGNATLTTTNPGVVPESPPDGGLPVGLVSASDAGTTIMIGTGTHPLSGACLALSSEDCGHCSWLSITLPPGTGTGTYSVGDGGVTVSLEGFAGTVSLTEVGSTITGSFNLSENGPCGLCSGTATGTFSIPATCDESVCAVLDAPPPSGCPGKQATYALPGAPAESSGEPGGAVFFTYGPGGGSLGLAAADIQSSLVDVYLSEGDGGFGPATQIVLDPNYPLSGDVGISGGIEGVAAADLNGDHVSDLVIATHLPAPYSGVGVLLGHGDGTFATPVYYPTETDGGEPDPSQPVVADLNGDGHIDVVVADYSLDLVSVLYGVGDGTLDAALNISLPNTNSVEPGTIATGDFNHDGKLDLVVGSIGRGSQMFLIPGQGASGFGAPVAFGPPEPNWGDNVQALAAAQLRPDSGIWDLVVADQGDGGLGTLSNPGFGLDVFLGNGDGTFQPPAKYTDPCLYDAVGSVNIADVNHDGILDLVGAFDSSQAYSTDLGVWLGNGDGTFKESASPVSVNTQGGFADVTTLAMAPSPGGTLLLITQPYFMSLMVEPVSSSCFGAGP